MPILTIVLAVIAAGLSLALGLLAVRMRRLCHLHRAEIETLMGIAGQARALDRVTATHHRDRAPETVERIIVREPAPSPAAPAVPAIDTEMIGRHYGAARIEGIAVEEIDPGDLDLDSTQGFAAVQGQPSHSDEDRIFFDSSLEAGRVKGWYFIGSGDQTHGPFKDRETAARAMKDPAGAPQPDEAPPAYGAAAGNSG